VIKGRKLASCQSGLRRLTHRASVGQFTPARWSSLGGHKWGSLGGRRGAEFGIEGFFFRYERHFVYWRRLSNGDIGIVTILHERTHQIGRFKEDFFGDPPSIAGGEGS